MSTPPTGAEYFQSQAESFETLYEALDYLESGGTFPIEEDEADYGLIKLQADLARELGGDISDDVDEDDVRDSINNYALCIDSYEVFQVRLTLGGPSASVDVHVSNGVIDYMEYVFAWGGDVFKRRLWEDDAMARYAEDQVQMILDTRE